MSAAPRGRSSAGRMSLMGSLAHMARLVRGTLLEPLRPLSIVLLHPGRCGSTVLGDLIGQHGNVWWDSEIYEIERQRRVAAGLSEDIPAPLPLLRSRMRLAGRALYGFELKFIRAEQLRFIHMDLPAYLAAIEAMGVDHFVVLKRRNLLRRLVSALVGFKTQQWHAKVGVGTSAVRVRVETGPQPFPTEGRTLVENFDVTETEFVQLRELLRGKPVLELSFEEDIEVDPRVGYRRLAPFMGLRPEDVTVRYQRTNPFPLQDLIENYEEVADALAGSSYEWMLETPAPARAGRS
jgi:hypothetical protein